MISALMASEAFVARIKSPSARTHFWEAEEVAAEGSFNLGYFNIVLRALQTLGIVRTRGAGSRAYCFTERVYDLLSLPSQSSINAMLEFSWTSFMSESGNPVDMVRASVVKMMVGYVEQYWAPATNQIASLLDGLVLAPLLIAVHKHTADWDYSSKIFKVVRGNCNPLAWSVIADLFTGLEWGRVTADFNEIVMSTAGRFLMERCLNMGVATSYAPLLLGSKDLVYGAPTDLFKYDEFGHETHVNRSLNVIGSGAMHGGFFDSLCVQIGDIFDNMEFSSQPRYIVDMGCGDGALLKSVFMHVAQRTIRGKHLDEAPLTMIGVDFNSASRHETSKALMQAEIPNLVIHGDIGDPEGMMKDLASHGVVERILHVRSFLDHDRPFLPIQNEQQLAFREKHYNSIYSGQYVTEDGLSLPASHVVQNLVEHLTRWASIIGEHGLVMLEVHCMEPQVTAKYLGMCAALYFDTCQSMSKQWLVEPATWLIAAAEAGLFPCHRSSLTLFPKQVPYKRMTLARFVKRQYNIRPASTADMNNLAELERAGSADQVLRKLHQPGDHFILQVDQLVLGVAFTQRVDSVDSLTARKEEAAHEPDGKVLHIVELTAHSYTNATMSAQEVRAALREFVLGYAEAEGMAQVVSVAQGRDDINFHLTAGAIPSKELPEWIDEEDSVCMCYTTCHEFQVNGSSYI